ncbi:hypothetical protein L0F63_004965 [Massospora cicadina]|nr:hypothetical protein L0F63_004965 [Massospora cicadina]
MVLVFLIKQGTNAAHLHSSVPTGLGLLEGILLDPPWPIAELEGFMSSLAHSFGAGLYSFGFPRPCNLRYVENLVWCQVTLENRFAVVSSDLVCKSKLILLIFKKGDEVEIRHQRTADVIFDFVKPESSWSKKVVSLEFKADSFRSDCPKPLAVYDMIETLLPNSRLIDPRQPRRLLEL